MKGARTGVYRVTFPSSPLGCAISVTPAQYLGAGIIGVNSATIDPPNVARFFTTLEDLGAPNSVAIGERDASGALVEGPFGIVANC